MPIYRGYTVIPCDDPLECGSKDSIAVYHGDKLVWACQNEDQAYAWIDAQRKAEFVAKGRA